MVKRGRPKSSVKKSVTPAERKQWWAAMKLAFDGALPWLHRLIEGAGYVGDLTHLTAREVARYFSVTPQAVGLWFSKSGCPRNDDGTYKFREVLKWRIEHEVKKRLDKQIAMSGGDPLLMGESSDALEEYRIVKTEQARFDLDIKQGKFLPTEQVESHWRELGHQVGATISNLEKKHPEAAEMLRDRVSAFDFNTESTEEKTKTTESTEKKKG